MGRDLNQCVKGVREKNIIQILGGPGGGGGGLKIVRKMRILK